LKAKVIAEFLKSELIGDANRIINGIGHIDTAEPSDLTYTTDNKKILTTKSTVIILQLSSISLISEKHTYIIHENPRCAFGKVVERYFSPSNKCQLKQGKNVKVDASAQIYVEGMSYERNPDGTLQCIPHMAGLILGDNVSVGPFSIVQRGVLKDTVIEEGAKIGPYCNIGHGAHLGKHCLVTGNNFVGGSASIGDYSYVAPHCTIKNGVHIGKRCFVGIGSLVLDDVPDGTTVVGRPAVPITMFKEQRRKLKKLLEGS